MGPTAGSYFVVFPDREDARAIAHRLAGAGSVVIDHPSGRPWLVVHGPEDQSVVSATVGANRIAVLGFSSATSERLDRIAGWARDRTDLDLLSHQLAGSFHLVASVGGTLRAQGSASGVRLIYRAVVDGVPVLSDRADVLAELGGFGYNHVSLALRLLSDLPHPVEEEPVWSGVDVVPPDHCALVDGDDRNVRTRRWWRRPEPTLSLAAGGEALRNALDEAVAARTRAGGAVHCDLSGGLDSTPICYFAANGPADVHAMTLYNDDVGGRDDVEWARKALPSMPNVRHREESMSDMPAFFAGLRDITERIDDPASPYLPFPRVRHCMTKAAGVGARVYLNGLGGDHLLHGMPSWNHTLLRRRPLLALRRARAVQLWEQQSPWTVMREMADNRSYRTWFGDIVDGAEKGSYLASRTSLEWGQPVILPRWLSPDMMAAVNDRLREIASTAEPLGRNRAAHSELSVVRAGARSVRGVQQLGAALGMPFESPFLDDRVMESCFAVRWEERENPQELKPLIKEAMRGRLPDEFLRRRTKTGGRSQAVRGHSAHWPELVELCAESKLVRDGVIDVDAFTEHASPRDWRQRDRNIDSTINCAIFLRTQECAEPEESCGHAAIAG
jgi:asparagine synthase (glutamine-hydrolysing)